MNEDQFRARYRAQKYLEEQKVTLGTEEDTLLRAVNQEYQKINYFTWNTYSDDTRIVTKQNIWGPRQIAGKHRFTEGIEVILDVYNDGIPWLEYGHFGLMLKDIETGHSLYLDRKLAPYITINPGPLEKDEQIVISTAMRATDRIWWNVLSHMPDRWFYALNNNSNVVVAYVDPKRLPRSMAGVKKALC